MHFQICPRCRFRSYELLQTHSHCINCNYSPDFDIEPQLPIPQWATEAFNTAELLAAQQRRKEAPQGLR